MADRKLHQAEIVFRSQPGEPIVDIILVFPQEDPPVEMWVMGLNRVFHDTDPTAIHRIVEQHLVPLMQKMGGKEFKRQMDENGRLVQ